MTLWIGLALVVVSAIALVPMLFPGGSEPATLEEMSERARPLTSPSRPLTVRVPETVGTRPAWWQRLRGVVGLLLLSVGIGCALAVAGAVVILILQRSIL